MRFDEINIIGEFKINGLTGSPGQALGLSGSDFTWITVSASSVIDAVGLTGTDYVICQSVNTGNPGADAIENGNRLKSAYVDASALYTSNRVSVLITPGDYDFDATPLQLTTNKVDLIGISSDASDVILRASDANSILGYESGVDSALYNLTLGTSLDIGVSGSGTSYLRWKNVIVSQNSFYNSVYGFENLNGEFEDIKCNNNSNFAKVDGDLNGTFNNIKIGNNTENVFSSNFGGIFGTFSNIEIGDVGNAFSSNSYITGYFKNITTGNVGSIISSSGQITGEFENITIGNVTNAIYGYTVSGTFNNITIGDASSTFHSENNITGTFSNIEVGNVSYLFFSTSDVDGSFKNITSGNVSNYAFSTYGTGNLTGTFENIKTGDNNYVFSIVGSGYINGIFKNIEIGNTTADVFLSDSNIIGTFSNIKIGTIQNTAFNASNGSIYGYFDNIEILEIINNSFCCLTNIDSTIKNLTISTIGSNFLSPENTLSGTFSNIKIGYCNSFMSAVDSINVNIKDLTVNAVGGDLFHSNSSLTGTYENIKIGTCSNAFVSTTSDINGYFDTIEIDGVGNNTKFGGTNLYGTYKNMKFTNTYNLFSVSNINATFENIEFSGNGNKVFHSTGGDISGTFSNITSSSMNSELFVANNIYGYYKDITLGTVTNFMGCGILHQSVVIDNLKVKSYIQNDNFRGKIINSFVDARGFNAYPIQLSSSVAPTIERCKFLSDISRFSIKSDGFTPNAKISFTITNNEIDGDITNIISDPKNIDNSNIT